MNVREYFEYLKAGKLSELNLGFNQQGGVTDNNIARVAAAIESGLRALYTRFPLYQKEVLVREYTAIKLYHLNSKYAQTNQESDVPYKYIEDTEADPFLDDILIIQEVYTGKGCPVPINDLNDKRSVFTTDHTTIQIPCAKHPNVTSVIYRAAPLPIDSRCESTQDLRLPDVLINALDYWVLAELYGAKTSQTDHYKHVQFKALYREQCDTVTHYGGLQTDNTTSMNFNNRGWV